MLVNVAAVNVLVREARSHGFQVHQSAHPVNGMVLVHLSNKGGSQNSSFSRGRLNDATPKLKTRVGIACPKWALELEI